MYHVSIKKVIQSSIITAVTIAVALIWKDVAMEVIAILVPAKNAFFYTTMTAILSTLILIIALYLILKTESEAEYVFMKFKKKKN